MSNWLRLSRSSSLLMASNVRRRHQLEGGIDDGARLLGIKPFDQGHGAFDVSEKSSDGLALTVNRPARLHCRLLSQNALS